MQLDLVIAVAVQIGQDSVLCLGSHQVVPAHQQPTRVPCGSRHTRGRDRELPAEVALEL